jgi:cytochrome b561
MTVQNNKFPVSMRIVHWLMLGGFILLFVTGPIMVDLEKEDPLRLTLFNLHKSIGVLALLFVAPRFLLRVRSVLPAFPAEFQEWEKKSAHIVHQLLYGFMLIVPLSGWAIADLHGRPVKLFGLTMPKLLPTVADIGAVPGLVHTVLAYTALGVIAFHLAGVLKHRYLDRQCVLRRMI